MHDLARAAGVRPARDRHRLAPGGQEPVQGDVLDAGADSQADVDLNVVMTEDGAFVDVQATAERVPFSRGELDVLLALAGDGIARIRQEQGRAVETDRA